VARAVETELIDADEAEQSQNAPERDSSEKPRSEKWDSEKQAPPRRISRWILLAFFAVASVLASRWWLNSQNYESTDDAQIEGHLDLVSASVEP
jgi:membrane fusion protein, multidrug efflux system